MSFTWTTVTQGVTNIAAAHINELRTATNALTTKLGVPAYSWVRLPVSSPAKVMYEDMTELRAGLDNAHNNNVCATYCADRDATVNATQCPTNNNNVETGNNATNHQNYLATPNYSSNNASPQYTSNNAANHQNYLASPNYSSNNATNHLSYNSGVNVSVA